MTSGLLTDRSLPFVKLEHYDGDTTTAMNKVTANNFGLAYAQLSGAALSPAFALANPNEILGKPAKASDTIPFKILLYDYHHLKPDALTTGDIQVTNSQILNVSGHL